VFLGVRPIADQIIEVVHSHPLIRVKLHVTYPCLEADQTLFRRATSQLIVEGGGPFVRVSSRPRVVARPCPGWRHARTMESILVTDPDGRLPPAH